MFLYLPLLPFLIPPASHSPSWSEAKQPKANLSDSDVQAWPESPKPSQAEPYKSRPSPAQAVEGMA